MPVFNVLSRLFVWYLLYRKQKSDMAERRQNRQNDRSFVADELQPLVGMYHLTIDNKKIVIPPNPDYGVLYNDGEIRLDDIVEITVGFSFINILVRDGYQFSFYRHEPLITCTRKTSLQEMNLSVAPSESR